jgi:hypothetical protein
MKREQRAWNFLIGSENYVQVHKVRTPFENVLFSDNFSSNLSYFVTKLSHYMKWIIFSVFPYIFTISKNIVCCFWENRYKLDAAFALRLCTLYVQRWNKTHCNFYINRCYPQVWCILVTTRYCKQNDTAFKRNSIVLGDLQVQFSSQTGLSTKFTVFFPPLARDSFNEFRPIQC